MEGQRVLLVRLSSLGDVIFNIPLANVLKANGYKVTWLVSEKGYDVIKDNPAVDETILAPFEKWKKQSFFKNFKEYFEIIKYIRSKKFDMAIDTQLLFKSFIWTAFCGAKRRLVSFESSRELAFLGGNEFVGNIRPDYSEHTVKNYLRFAKYLGLDTEKIEVCLPVSNPEAVQKIDSLLAGLDKTKPVILIAPATTWAPKHWNKDNWKELVSKLEKDYTLVFSGTKKDNDLIEYIRGDKGLNLAGKTNLLELSELYNRCDLVISLDSGSTHLAWANGHPKIVSIFCCTPKTLYAPIGDENKYIALSGNLTCQPCHKKHCPKKQGQNKCTLVPTVDEVLVAVNKLEEINAI